MSRVDALVKHLCPDGVPFQSLDRVAVFHRGEALSTAESVGGDYRVVTASRSSSLKYHEFNFDGESVTVTSHGAYAGFVSYWNEPVWLSNNVFLLRMSEEVQAKFLYYFLKARPQLIRENVRGGGIPYFNARDIAKIRIPVGADAKIVNYQAAVGSSVTV